MKPGVEHPDVVPYAQNDPLTKEQRASIEQHLADCGECRDLVVFVRKTNATLQFEGKISRVAKALGISVAQLEREVRLGTSIAALINPPPGTSLNTLLRPTQPLSPAKK